MPSVSDAVHEAAEDMRALKGGLISRVTIHAIDRNGDQPGDPVLAAKAIIQAVTSENPPLHLLLGALAYQRAATKIENLQKDFEAWRDIALATDFDAAR